MVRRPITAIALAKLPRARLIAIEKAIRTPRTFMTMASGSATPRVVAMPDFISITRGSTAASQADSDLATYGASAEAVQAASGLEASISASLRLTLITATTGFGIAMMS